MIERPLIALVNDDARFLGLASDLLGQHGFRTVLYTLRDEGYVDLRLSRPSLILISLPSECPVAAWQLLNSCDLTGSPPRSRSLSVRRTCGCWLLRRSGSARWTAMCWGSRSPN